MTSLVLHQFHQALGARFTSISGEESVTDYGDFMAEYTALGETAGLVDLSSRGRLCLTGSDRVRFLHGQVTNNIKDLGPGEGCYAALVTAKGKMQSDLNIYRLQEELLLDFEPGLTSTITKRMEHYIIADDVQVVDVGSLYGLLSVHGPAAGVAVERSGVVPELPAGDLQFSTSTVPALGDVYCMNHTRSRFPGFDLFIPATSLQNAAEQLLSAIKAVGGRACGWQALEARRIEAGLPRFGVDMDESNLPPEVGIEARAVSYSKGCYIGQEVIARIRTYGQVAKALRGLKLADDLAQLPGKGEKLLHDGKEVGHVTSALASPALGCNIALGYVRREHNQIGERLQLAGSPPTDVKIVPLPFTACEIAIEN